MSDPMIQCVISQLKDYHAKQRRIAVLRYELSHPANVSLDDVIGAMSFSKGDNEGRSLGHISNKTMYIALNYRQEAERLKNTASDEIMAELLRLENEIERLDFYIGLLEEQLHSVVVMCYIEGLTLQQIAENMSISPWNVRKLRDEAVTALAEMYGYTRQNSGQ